MPFLIGWFCCIGIDASESVRLFQLAHQGIHNLEDDLSRSGARRFRSAAFLMCFQAVLRAPIASL